MATGSGKTFTAVTAIYRLIKFAGARRVLFLVDRGNLGRADAARSSSSTSRPTTAASSPSCTTSSTCSSNTHRPGQPGSASPPSSGCTRCCRARPSSTRTIEEGSLFETDAALDPGAAAGRLQPEHPDRDLRRHRHRRVPPLHLQPLAAGARVLRRLPDRPDRHADQADARLLQPEPGDGVQPRAGRRRRRQRRLRRLPHPHRRSPSRARTVEAGLLRRQARPPTRAQVRWEQLDEDLDLRRRRSSTATWSPTDQIRTVVRTFRDKLFTEIFPGRTEVPKTLIFAKDDSHAEDIVQIVREEFGKGNDFCQKITYRTTGEKPEDLLADVPQQLQPAHRRHGGHDRHRHRHQAARDRDVHARRSRAANYFEQMKGRGVRVINRTTSGRVTPDAPSQDPLRHRGLRSARCEAEPDRPAAPGAEAARLLQEAAPGRRLRQHRSRTLLSSLGVAAGPAGQDAHTAPAQPGCRRGRRAGPLGAGRAG